MAASSRISLAAHSASPKIRGTREPAVDGLRRLGHRLLLGQARLDDVGAEHVDVLEWVAGGLDAGDIDGLDLADMGEDGVQLSGVAVELVVG